MRVTEPRTLRGARAMLPVAVAAARARLFRLSRVCRDGCLHRRSAQLNGINDKSDNRSSSEPAIGMRLRARAQNADVVSGLVVELRLN